jgi:uncharacterized protein
MRNLLVAIAVFLLICFTPSLAIGKAPTAKSLLWEISGNQLSQPSYLFGTIHMSCWDKVFLTTQQQQAVEKSQQLYLEVDYNKIGDYGNIIGGKRLKDMMNPNEHEKVTKFFRKYGFAASDIATKRPYHLALIVETLERREVFSKQCTDIISREQILIDAAKHLKIKVFGVETVKDRAEIGKQIPLKDEVDILLSTIDTYQQPKTAEIEKKINDTQQLYFSEDINEMAKIDPDLTAATRRMYGVVLGGRSRSWIPRMRKAMAKKSTFFGFGAAHLGGEAGVISLLESEGYKLKPIFDNKRP